jgi:hypothetical protein
VLVCEGAYVYAMELFVKTDVNKVSQQGFWWEFKQWEAPPSAIHQWVKRCEEGSVTNKKPSGCHSVHVSDKVPWMLESVQCSPMRSAHRHYVTLGRSDKCVAYLTLWLKLPPVQDSDCAAAQCMWHWSSFALLSARGNPNLLLLVTVKHIST